MARRTSPEPQLVRQWSLLQDLASNRFGWHVAELARRHRVSKATIQRDLRVLERVFQVAARPAKFHKQCLIWRAESPPGGIALREAA
jgi:predicted DNA-binding transcriptional regulator YafY